MSEDLNELRIKVCRYLREQYLEKGAKVGWAWYIRGAGGDQCI